MGEDWAGMELEAARLRIVDRHAQDIAGQQIGGELHALEVQSQRGRQRMGQRGLAQAGQVLDQQMAIGQQRDEGQAHLARLAKHQSIDLRLGLLQSRRQGLG